MSRRMLLCVALLVAACSPAGSSSPVSVPTDASAYTVVSPRPADPGPAVALMTQFVAALDAGNYDAAYMMLGPTARSDFSDSSLVFAQVASAHRGGCANQHSSIALPMHDPYAAAIAIPDEPTIESSFTFAVAPTCAAASAAPINPEVFLAITVTEGLRIYLVTW